MTERAKTTKEVTRDYFDSLMLEMRLIDSEVPDTGTELYGKKFQTPIMTAALSHLGTFHPDMPNVWCSMRKVPGSAGPSTGSEWGSDEEFEAVTATGAQTIRIIKPYCRRRENLPYDPLRGEMRRTGSGNGYRSHV